MIYVFGATGFVGRNLIARLAAGGREVIAISRSGTIVPGAAESLGMADLDILGPAPPGAIAFHLAAHRYDASGFAMAQSDILTANVALTDRIYAFCARAGIKEMRLASSVAVYPARLPIMDDAEPVDLNAPPHPAEAFYAWSKRWGEITARLYAEAYGVCTLAFRLSNPYGPLDSLDPAAAHVLPAFVMRALAPGEVFRLHGDPHVERDFVFIDDVIDVFERSVAWRGRNDAFNLCLGRTTTLLDLAKAVLAAVGSDKRIDLDETFTPAAVRVRRSSCARLREAFELGPFTELAQGLPATVAWYRDALSA